MANPNQKKEKTVGLHVYIPEPLFIQVKLLLLDPLTGRVGYGKMTALITSMLKDWVEQQKKEASRDE